MLNSFARDWARWSKNERIAATLFSIVGFGSLVAPILHAVL